MCNEFLLDEFRSSQVGGQTPAKRLRKAQAARKGIMIKTCFGKIHSLTASQAEKVNLEALCVTRPLSISRFSREQQYPSIIHAIEHSSKCRALCDLTKFIRMGSWEDDNFEKECDDKIENLEEAASVAESDEESSCAMDGFLPRSARSDMPVSQSSFDDQDVPPPPTFEPTPFKCDRASIFDVATGASASTDSSLAMPRRRLKNMRRRPPDALIDTPDIIVDDNETDRRAMIENAFIDAEAECADSDEEGGGDGEDLDKDLEGLSMMQRLQKRHGLPRQLEENERKRPLFVGSQ